MQYQMFSYILFTNGLPNFNIRMYHLYKVTLDILGTLDQLASAPQESIRASQQSTNSSSRYIYTYVYGMCTFS